MKRQISFAEAESAGEKRVTRRQRFLAEMERVVPWSRLLAAIEPHYPKGGRGRPPIGLERMLRIYFLQQWYGLSDEVWKMRCIVVVNEYDRLVRETRLQAIVEANESFFRLKPTARKI
ncbi:Transposase domain [Paraburkholderia tuberum]|uniref:Transposase domain n=1 Tax=Paraburkholderia tuberum TaxID=157910 RepID=A0A1H1KJQ9_9BURK|nr:Transposase domain [Paraburkholderia tuberum]